MAPRRSYWLIKSEPSVFSYATLVEHGRTRWDGVRNYEARNNLRAMKKGDLALYYHSGESKAIVGVAQVIREAYQDPTTKEDWSAVDFEPFVALAVPVTLASIRVHPTLGGMALVKKGRISVTPVTASEFRDVLKAGKTTLPKA